MTNGNEAEFDAGTWAAAIAQAADAQAAASVQRRAEAEVMRETRAVIANAEWNALTPAEREARIAEEDAAYEAESARQVAEAEAELDEPEAEPELEAG